MSTADTRLIRIVAALLLGVAAAGAPVTTLAGGHFGGGGGHFGGGGHMGGGGGGHFGGGGHMGGGGGGHFGGGPFGGGPFSGGHSAGGGPMAAAAGAHFAPFSGARSMAPHFAAPAMRTFHAPVHGGFATMSAMHAAGPVSGGAFVPGWWGGGFWHGVFWPPVVFRPHFVFFLPVLPFGFTTFWWGGVPYYYWNSLYYTWSPVDRGYVVTDPPPVAGSNPSDSSSGYGDGGGGADVYLYPRNGQSDAQTQQDRYECHSWAVSQTGFDPTRSSRQSSGSAADYRRAMIACLDARGYSAR